MVVVAYFSYKQNSIEATFIVKHISREVMGQSFRFWFIGDAVYFIAGTLSYHRNTHSPSTP